MTIKGNKTEKQTSYANNDSSHTTTKSKNNSNSNNNNTNSYSSNDNIQDTITPNPSDQSAGEWKKGTALIVGDSMIAGLREAKLSTNRKVKAHFPPGVIAKDLMFHLIP